MKAEIELGSLQIPIIKPVKGIDYFTTQEVQEIINEVYSRLNLEVEEAEEGRATAEAQRQSKEAERQANETERENVKTQLETLISNIEDMIDNGELQGEQGTGIENIEVTNEYTLKITLSNGTIYESASIRGATGEKGENGEDGQDGFSPTITETQTTIGYDITITDKNGTRTISLLNGQDGQDGTDGQDGQDGEDGISMYAGYDSTNEKLVINTMTDGNEVAY